MPYLLHEAVFLPDHDNSWQERVIRLMLKDAGLEQFSKLEMIRRVRIQEDLSLQAGEFLLALAELNPWDPPEISDEQIRG